jgi:hypothetical protein
MFAGLRDGFGDQKMRAGCCENQDEIDIRPREKVVLRVENWNFPFLSEGATSFGRGRETAAIFALPATCSSRRDVMCGLVAMPKPMIPTPIVIPLSSSRRTISSAVIAVRVGRHRLTASVAPVMLPLQINDKRAKRGNAHGREECRFHIIW